MGITERATCILRRLDDLFIFSDHHEAVPTDFLFDDPTELYAVFKDAAELLEEIDDEKG